MALFLLGLAYDLFREEKIGQNTFSICSGIAAFYVLTIAGGRLYTGGEFVSPSLATSLAGVLLSLDNTLYEQSLTIVFCLRTFRCTAS